MKIGILTYHRSNNYGAFLQAYALCQRLNQENWIEAEIIDFRMKIEKKEYNPFLKYKNPKKLLFALKQDKAFKKDIRRAKLSSRMVVSDSNEDFREMVYAKYDVIIAGSDEIWKINSFRGFPTPYWLIGDLGCKKIGYAISARTSFSKLDDRNLEIVKKAINEFELIGVRDRKTFDEVSKYLENNKKVRYCCDPSFIYDFKADVNNGKKILRDRYNISNDKKCVGVMIKSQEVVSWLKYSFGDKIEVISLFEWNNGVVKTPELTPFEWIDVLASLDFMITSYFHGMCFSIINNVPFVAIEVRAQSDDESKLYDFLNRMDIKDRYYLGVDEAIRSTKFKEVIYSSIIENSTIDYSYILNEFREDIKGFLNILKTLNDK